MTSQQVNFLLIVAMMMSWAIGRSLPYRTITQKIVGGILVVIMLGSILVLEWRLFF